VTLAFDVETVLPQLRGEAEARMTETAKLAIESVGTDPDTLEDTVTETVQTASVACRVRFRSLAVSERELASQYVAAQDVELHFPSGTVVETDWIATILTSTADAGLVGRRFRIKGHGAAGQTTALRVPVEEVS
jgi:hypothetical protein